MVISLTAFISLNLINIFWKQYLFWWLGFFLFFSSYFINYRFIFERFYIWLIVGFSLFLLVLVLFSSGNIKSWFSIGDFRLQPSEFAKLGFFLLLAKFISYYYNNLKNFVFVIFSFVTLLPFIVLLVLQPDFGMIMLYLLVWVFTLITFLSKRQIIFGLLLGVLILLIMWFFVFKDYQKARFISFINYDYDPLGSGYNMRQIKLILSISDFFGKGVGFGNLGRNGYLPSAHTDFILTSLIEERGLLIFIIYSILMFMLINFLEKYQNYIKFPEISNFIFITKNYFFVKFLITSLVNFGLFPIVGLPVAFLSYGGSHLIFDLWLLGIIVSLIKYNINL